MRSDSRGLKALLVFCMVVIAGCGGRGASIMLPLATKAALPTAKSISPASFSAPPMVSTRYSAASMNVRAPQSAIAPLGWTQLPGAGVYAAASPDGSLWVLSTFGGPDHPIYHYANGSWTNIPGAATGLAVAPDNTLWAVNSAGGIYHWDGSAWSTIAGGASDITVASDGSVYVISSVSGGTFGRGIWHFASGNWTQMPGAGVQIAASSDSGSYGAGIAPGGFYVINGLQSIYYYNPSLGFQQLPGAAVQLAPTSNGGVFALGVPGGQYGNPIYYNDLSAGTWTQQPGAGIAIATDTAHVYVIGASGGIYLAPMSVAGPVEFDTPGIDAGISSSSGLVPAGRRLRPDDFGNPATSANLSGHVEWISQIGQCRYWAQPGPFNNYPPHPKSEDTATCGPTSAAMAAAYVMGRHPSDIVKTIVDNSSGKWPCGDGTGGAQLALVLRKQFGLQAYYHPFDAAALVSAIQNNHPVVTQVYYRGRDGTFNNSFKHYVLVVSISPTGVVVNDPGRPDTPSRRPDAEYVRIPIADFIRAWNASDNLFGIEVGPNAAQQNPGDFAISALPTTLTVSRGQTATYSVSVQSLSGFNSPVTLSVTGLPANVIYGTGFVPQPVVPPANTTQNAALTIVTDPATPTGQFPVVVQGLSGNSGHQTSIVLNVVASDNVAPNVTTAAASSLGSGSATLSGVANPNGGATAVHFDWGTSSSYGNATAAQPIGSGSGIVGFSNDLANLTPSTTYHYRAVAQSAAGATTGNDSMFTTLTRSGTATAPNVTTGFASNIGQTAATLNGAAIPNGSTTRAFFQWGATTAYGNATSSQVLGSGTSPVSASIILNGLNPNTIYHYRLVAMNSAATINGDDVSFVTAGGGTAPVPSISGVSPNPVRGSNGQQTITINGVNFANKPTMILTWTGQPGYTVPAAQVTYLSNTQVQMAITTTTTPDNWTVNVTNPDGQSSNTVGFTVAAPQGSAPSISGVNPNPVTGSNSQQTVTINGANFVNKPTLILTWSGQPGYTVPSGQVTFVSSTQVQMSITTTTTPDNWTVRVTNPDSQSSNTVGFTVVAPQGSPAPSISSVSPNPVTGSNSQQTVTINGANFVNKPTLILTWSGQPGYTVPSGQVTFVSSTQVQMSITTTTAPDSWTVKVTNPDSQSSNTAGFTVVAPQQAPAPSISGVIPNPVTGSNSQQTVTINGANFVNKPTLILTWSGQPGYTVPSGQVTFVSSTQVQMSITTTTTPDNWTVRVTNPDSQSSNTVGFTVMAPQGSPAPSISSVSPNPVTGSNSRQTITIYGANFVNKPTLILTWSGQPGYTVPAAQVTFVSSTEVQMSITTTTTPDNWTVRATNPDSQSSNAVGFKVQ